MQISELTIDKNTGNISKYRFRDDLTMLDEAFEVVTSHINNNPNIEITVANGEPLTFQLTDNVLNKMIEIIIHLDIPIADYDEDIIHRAEDELANRVLNYYNTLHRRSTER